MRAIVMALVLAMVLLIPAPSANAFAVHDPPAYALQLLEFAQRVEQIIALYQQIEYWILTLENLDEIPLNDARDVIALIEHVYAEADRVRGLYYSIRYQTEQALEHFQQTFRGAEPFDEFPLIIDGGEDKEPIEILDLDGFYQYYYASLELTLEGGFATLNDHTDSLVKAQEHLEYIHSKTLQSQGLQGTLQAMASYAAHTAEQVTLSRQQQLGFESTQTVLAAHQINKETFTFERQRTLTEELESYLYVRYASQVPLVGDSGLDFTE